MKTKIMLGFVMVLLLAFGASAGLFPEPVSGQVTLPGYSSLEGLNLEHKNVRTGMVYVVELDENGYYTIDWANLPHFPEDKVEMSIAVCKDNPVCRKSYVLEGNPMELDLVVPSSFSVEKTTETLYVCPDGSEVKEASLCPAIPVKVVEVVKEVIKDNTNYEVLKEVKTERDYLIYASAALGLLLVVAGGILAKYRWGKGFVATATRLKKKGDEALKAGNRSLAEKYYKQAEKQLRTALEKDKKGLYKK